METPARPTTRPWHHNRWISDSHGGTVSRLAILLTVAVLLVAVGDPQYQSDSKNAGSAGIFTFHFQAVVEGETQVEIVCHRPWEDTDLLQTYSLTVTVS